MDRTITETALDIVRAMRRKNDLAALAATETNCLEVLRRPVCDANIRGAAHALLGAIVATSTKF